MPDVCQAVPEPSAWVVRHAENIPSGGTVLDLACGSGRHTRLLRRLGYSVLATDTDLERIKDLEGQPGIELRQADLEQDSWPFEEKQFTGIVVTNYLHRPHLDKLTDCLTDSGILIYETFAVGNEQYGKPSSPDYLLQPGELLQVFGDRLEVVAFEQGLIHEPGPKVIQRLCARRPATR
ncbi:MAG: class I SAM-dependent methyltransferase [Gammaproteobacteria bacterium]|jgi:SAM-dependent methyltransferase|nr:class I SAM-dependent methyltransferase [Gammaproteobacteria bacterium]MDP6617749.1 class I SAM-dependent methyltransferase [Gammaproteobacteria bacterium]MDP6694135.1 class I SAM-dependent methyltransferase [Gammaproteobacteria bacterium]